MTISIEAAQHQLGYFCAIGGTLRLLVWLKTKLHISIMQKIKTPIRFIVESCLKNEKIDTNTEGVTLPLPFHQSKFNRFYDGFYG